MKLYNILFSLLLANSCQQTQKTGNYTESNDKGVSTPAQNIALVTSKTLHDTQAGEIDKKEGENRNSGNHDEEFDLLNNNRVWNIFAAHEDDYHTQFGTDIYSFHGCMVFGSLGTAAIRFPHDPEGFGLMVEKLEKNRYKLRDRNHSRVVSLKKLNEKEYCSNGPGLHIVTHRPKGSKSDDDWAMLDEGFEFRGRKVPIACTLPEWKTVELCLKDVKKHDEYLRSIGPP